MAVNHLSFIHFLEASQFELFSRYRHFVEEWPDETNKNKINK
jgi:hypothetical protein